MANYRQIHTNIWTDSWFLELDTQEKLLFIYLFSNDRTSLSGIYELHKKVISFETGISVNAITKMLQKFQDANKVYVEGNVVWVVHMRKFHETKSDTVLQRIKSDVNTVPECELKKKYLAYMAGIPYGYPMDAVPIPDTQLKGIGIGTGNEDEDEITTAAVIENPDIATISKVYESEIGVLTATVRDELVLALEQYPSDWIAEALKESARQNKRNWRYSLGILKRWKVDGFKVDTRKQAASTARQKPDMGNYKVSTVSEVVLE